MKQPIILDARTQLTYRGKPIGTHVVPTIHHRGGKATDTIEPYSV
jgi:hypothetical protein